MNIAIDSQWKHDANNFAVDNDYEKEFESYISDDVDDEGKTFFFEFFYGRQRQLITIFMVL